jgi:hypothetical protein
VEACVWFIDSMNALSSDRRNCASLPLSLAQLHVDFAARFQHAARLVDLRGGRLAVGDALVQRAPVDRRQARADRHAVAGGQVALDEHGVVEDLVGLREQLGDGGHAPFGVLSLGPVRERQRIGAQRRAGEGEASLRRWPAARPVP